MKVNTLTQLLRITIMGLLVFSIGLTQAQAKGQKVNPKDYPRLNEKRIGMIRHIHRCFTQPLGEFRWMKCDRVCGTLDDDTTLQYPVGVTALALAHYHWTPAYRELYQQAVDGAVQQLLHEESWGHWAFISTLPWGFPELTEDPYYEPIEVVVDPVKDRHVWYTGALCHALGLYATLFDDLKYDKPGAIKFYWPDLGGLALKPSIKDGTLLPRATYSWTDLTKIFLDQLKDEGYLGVQCFENAVWVACNQGNLMDLKLYDYKHGTNYAKPTHKKYIEAWRKWMTDVDERAWPEKAPVLKSGSFPSGYYIKHAKVTSYDPNPSPHFDGWIGYQMNTWYPELMRSIFPLQKKQWVKELSDGTATVRMKEGAEPFMVYFCKSYHGYFALLAAEMGDLELANKMLAYSEKYKEPVWEDGCYYFEPVMTIYDEEGRFVWGTRLESLALSCVALMPKGGNGLATIVNQPWDKKHFSEPYISKVQYPEVLVSQAWYDDKKETLIVTVQPGTGYTGSTSFLVNQLDASKKYKIIKDGKALGAFNQGQVEPGPGAKVVLEQADKGTLKISTDISQPHTFLVQAVK